ncbi:MAG: protoheme IX farnesyltransferase [Candidatus Eisenbacteria bacterium]|nr:protoheme IX farnesyltransferase [Candidatus Eisenbacteria bacterium]
MSVALGAPTRAATLRAWVELTKPRIVMLVLFTGLPAALLAGSGSPPARVFWGAGIGIALSAAAAAAFNHYYDRDIDGLMVRTRSRPLPAGILTPAHAATLGLLLSWASYVVLAVFCNPFSALIAMASIFYYAVVYTIWLKRRTPQNIVIGGGAGATAPIIAWAAVTGHVGLPAILIAAIVFLWTPPHFWALALYRREDYQRANLPMLPVTHGEPETRRQILLYSIVLVALTLVIGPFTGLGAIYTTAAAVLGALFIMGAVRLWREKSVPRAMQLFRFSILYLFALFLCMTVDAWLRLRAG